MEREAAIQARLKKPYIQVQRKSGDLTYGGDQGFFRGGMPGSVEERKNAMGCGVIAFSDLVLYLGNDGRVIPENRNYVNRINSEEEYKQYYNGIYDYMGGVSMKNGISGIKLAMRFNRLSRREGWQLHACWGLSAGKLYRRMKQMLALDLPVVLCIPMMLFKKDKGNGITFYLKKNGKMEKACTVSAHYVMVTGIFEENKEIFLELSSWGKKYYINWNEYDNLIHNHFLGTILGNILYIR